LSNISTISILGCGWLGLPLAKALAVKKFNVKGSVTSPEKFEALRRNDVLPYHLVLGAADIMLDDPRFFETDLLIVSIPPRRTEDVERVFPARIAQLIHYLEKYRVQRVLFISSTSVYPETVGIAKEENVILPDKASGRALIEAENLLIRNENFKTTVVRFGGLIGADRNPAGFLTRQKGIIDGSKPVNLIHRDDCILIIIGLIDQEVWEGIFNACCPQHPGKKEFYETASEISGIPAPVFGEGSSSFGKIVDSTKLIARLNYSFIYPSPIDWLATLKSF
jgi:nucleoside-diphosphate-sugar epimerase